MPVLADTSAWVHFLRASGSSTHLTMREKLSTGEVVTCDPVVLELLAGARHDEDVRRYGRLLGGVRHVATIAYRDAAAAAELYRVCRRAGETIRSFHDCHIAAMALRLGLPVLHRDRDYEALARHTRLAVLS